MNRISVFASDTLFGAPLSVLAPIYCPTTAAASAVSIAASIALAPNNLFEYQKEIFARCQAKRIGELDCLCSMENQEH